MPDQPENNRTDQGQFAPGVSGNPNGRPAGAYSRSTQLARLLLARNAGPLVKKCIERALAGDAVALRLTIERLAPIPKAGSVRIELPKICAAEDVAVAINCVVEATAAGLITLDDADRLVALLDRQRIALEGPELELRLRELEHQIKEMHLAQMGSARSEHRPNGRAD